MTFSRKVYITAFMVFCATSRAALADVSADDIMLRRKSTPSGTAVSLKKVAPAPVADVSVEKAAGSSVAGEKVVKKSNAPKKDAVITADRTDYDRKEGVVLFDRNVHVDDEQYGEGEIVEVFMKGYIKGDRVIRHSVVKVAN